MQADKPYGVANAVLTEIATRLAAAGVTVPARRYVSIGVPALDCEQLVVSIDRIIGHEGDPSVESTRPQRCLTMRALEVTVWLMRCAPVLADDGTPPSVDALTASAIEIAQDPPSILQALIDADRAGALGSLWGVVFLGWRALTPEGGFAGGAQTVRYDLSAPLPT